MSRNSSSPISSPDRGVSSGLGLGPVQDLDEVLSPSMSRAERRDLIELLDESDRKLEVSESPRNITKRVHVTT